LAALSATERDQLADLLGRVAEQQGLEAGVHPGYANVAAKRRKRFTRSGR
jgi:hypothetical protein